MASLFRKDPAAVLDFGVDWRPHSHGRPGAPADWLEPGETITDFSFTAACSPAPAGLAVEDGAESDGLVTAWISGGQAGQTYTLACQITTSAGRTDRRSFRLKVERR